MIYMTFLGGVLGLLPVLFLVEKAQKHRLKKSYRSYFRRAQIRWVILSSPKGIKYRFPHELCGKICDCSWPPKKELFFVSAEWGTQKGVGHFFLFRSPFGNHFVTFLDVFLVTFLKNPPLPPPFYGRVKNCFLCLLAILSQSQSSGVPIANRWP